MDDKVNILITGDFHAGGRIGQLIEKRSYQKIFNEFLNVIQNSDYAVTNLESALIEEGVPIEKSGPAIKSSPQTAKALKYAGFNLVTLANNHIMDYGWEGLSSTISLCEANGINYVGAGENNEFASKPLIVTIKGRIIAFMNFAENEFSTTTDHNPGANPIDPVKNFMAICEAKKIAERVVVIVHGGHEKYNLPSPRMKSLYRFYADAGADAVINHHTHYYSGFEIYNGVPIFYSLGNFVFDKTIPDMNWHTGFAVEIIFGKDTQYSLHPYNQCIEGNGIELLAGEKRANFMKTLERLNLTISSDDILKNSFEKYCKDHYRLYSSYMEPHTISFLHFLRNRRLFPSMISNKKRRLYLNLIRCESHRDVLIYLLKNRHLS